jgi:hypothetical protein
MPDFPWLPEMDPARHLALGLEAMQNGETDKAIRHLEAAERGLADAAEPLGRAYVQEGRYREAELAWRRALTNCSEVSIRRIAALGLIGLYRAVGGPGTLAAQAEMLAYLEALSGPTSPPVPQPRIQRTPNGGYTVSDPGHGLRRRVGRLIRRIGIAGAVLAGGFGIAQGIDWVFHRFP